MTWVRNPRGWVQEGGPLKRFLQSKRRQRPVSLYLLHKFMHTIDLVVRRADRRNFWHDLEFESRYSSARTVEDAAWGWLHRVEATWVYTIRWETLDHQILRRASMMNWVFWLIKKPLIRYHVSRSAWTRTPWISVNWHSLDFRESALLAIFWTIMPINIEIRYTTCHVTLTQLLFEKFTKPLITYLKYSWHIYAPVTRIVLCCVYLLFCFRISRMSLVIGSHF